MKRIFTRAELDAMGVPYELDCGTDCATELHEEQIDARRWVSVHELVFRAPDDGKAWRVTYERGLTEMQEDTDPWGDAATVEAVEVKQRTRMVEVTDWCELKD